jgi:hypothetical protein
MASREIFKVAVYLEDQNKYKGPNIKHQTRYKAWCKLIKSPLTGELESSFPAFETYMDEIERQSLENKEYTATLGLSNRVTVEATLGLEDFMGRKEFILTINIRRGASKEGKPLEEKQEDSRQGETQNERNGRGSNKTDIFSMLRWK